MSDVDHTRDVCDTCEQVFATANAHVCARAPGPIFAGNWESLEDLQEWEGAYEHLSRPGVELLFAEYDTPPYEGNAWALWRESGELWEASCSHCSCNGLDFWLPELTSIAALKMRPQIELGGGAMVELRKVLKESDSQ